MHNTSTHRPGSTNETERDNPNFTRGTLELPCHEVLSGLARNDPAAYEALRCDLIEDFINSSPEDVQARLRGIQFRVDGARQISRSALGATLRVYELMWESFLDLNHGLQDLVETQRRSVSGVEPDPIAQAASKESAQVLEFRPRRDPA